MQRGFVSFGTAEEINDAFATTGKQHRFGKRQSKRSDLPLLGDIVDRDSEDIFDDVPDFHRQVKAEFLSISPTQIVRETTLEPDAFKKKSGQPVRRTQDRATVAWNLATGLYYKTLPVPPWRLFGVRAGVCYVGLVYKNIPNDPNDHACCAAQMFLSEGDGVVFRGANGPWKTGDYEFHLKPDAAKDLIRKVLTTYAELHKGPANRAVHSWTGVIQRRGVARIRGGCASGETNVVGVRIRTTNGETKKLFRDSDYPVLRGTALILDEKNAYLWTTGYVLQLDTYIGPETPNPLFITVLKSKKTMPELKTVLNDIMGLTKINYNSCNFNDGLPVTVRFANMVGEVLTMGSAQGTERQPFKYYVWVMPVRSAGASMRNEYTYAIAQCDVPPDKRPVLESFRDKRRVWLSWIDADEHHAIWQVLSSMVWSDASFKTLTQFAIDDENSALNNSLLAEALLSGHVANQVLAIRHSWTIEVPTLSLRRLVKDLRRSWPLFTRENYVCFDGLPYDYEAVQREEMQRMVGKGAFWGEASGPGAYSTSRMAHEQFDRLAGIDPANRRREKINSLFRSLPRLSSGSTTATPTS